MKHKVIAGEFAKMAFQKGAMTLSLVKDSGFNTKLVFFRSNDAKFNDFMGQLHEVNVRVDKNDFLICCGCGDKPAADDIRTTAAYGIQRAEHLRWQKLSVVIPAWFDKRSTVACVEGLVLGSYKFDAYRTKKYHHLSSIEVATDKVTEQELKEAVTVCQGTNFARDMVNRNAKDKYPEAFASFIKDELAPLGVNVTMVPDELMRRFGLINAVSAGSPQPARVVVVQYNGDTTSDEKIGLIGKGIIFDTGGLELKDPDNIKFMRKDIAGAAAMIALVRTAAVLEMPINIVCVLPLTYNSIDGKSCLPGDVYKSYSGKTVEIENTDAEGRLILADAISFCIDHFKPAAIIDMATLTKAIATIFGKSAAGLFTNDSELGRQLYRAGRLSNERVWLLPLFKEYKQSITSDIADLKNSFEQQQAKSAVAAAFIRQFVRMTPWAHIDMSNVAFNEELFDIEYSYGELPHYATGYGVRLLWQFLKSRLATKKPE